MREKTTEYTDDRVTDNRESMADYTKPMFSCVSVLTRRSRFQTRNLDLVVFPLAGARTPNLGGGDHNPYNIVLQVLTLAMMSN